MSEWFYGKHNLDGRLFRFYKVEKFMLAIRFLNKESFYVQGTGSIREVLYDSDYYKERYRVYVTEGTMLAQEREPVDLPKRKLCWGRLFSFDVLDYLGQYHFSYDLEILWPREVWYPWKVLEFQEEA